MTHSKGDMTHGKGDMTLGKGDMTFHSRTRVLFHFTF